MEMESLKFLISTQTELWFAADVKLQATLTILIPVLGEGQKHGEVETET